MEHAPPLVTNALSRLGANDPVWIARAPRCFGYFAFGW